MINPDEIDFATLSLLDEDEKEELIAERDWSDDYPFDGYPDEDEEFPFYDPQSEDYDE